MRTSKIDNYHDRIVWLRKIKTGEITIKPGEFKYFYSLKEFCKMKGDSFTSIAYNSLKSAANFIDASNKNCDSSWDELKSAFHEAKDMVSISMDSSPPLLPNLEIMAEKALLDAHICSMAYMELLAFLSSLPEALDKNPIQAVDKIRTQLKISTVKFKSIISYADNYDCAKPALTLIKK